MSSASLLMSAWLFNIGSAVVAVLAILGCIYGPALWRIVRLAWAVWAMD